MSSASFFFRTCYNPTNGLGEICVVSTVPCFNLTQSILVHKRLGTYGVVLCRILRSTLIKSIFLAAFHIFDKIMFNIIKILHERYKALICYHTILSIYTMYLRALKKPLSISIISVKYIFI